MALPSARDVMDLHQQTGAPVLTARQALIDAGGDVEAAAAALTTQEAVQPARAPRPPRAPATRTSTPVTRPGAVDSALGELEVLTPGEAIRRLERGEALRRVRVNGLRLTGSADLRIRITNSVLTRVRLAGTFGQRVAIQTSVLEHGRLDPGAVFEHGLSLKGSTLREFHVHAVTIREPFDLSAVHAAGELAIKGATFDSVRAWNADFGGWVRFELCRFVGVLDLRSIDAHEGMWLTDCVMEGDVLFRGAAIGGRLDLGGTRVLGHVDLSRAKLRDYVYLEEMQQGEGQTFSFVNIVADKLLVTPAQVTGRLRSERQGEQATAATEFGLLRANYQAMHRHDEEDWAYRHYKQCRRRMQVRGWRHPRTTVAQFLDWLFLDLGCGYATSPGRTVRSALVLVLGFALVYALGTGGFDASTPLAVSAGADADERLMFGVVTSAALFTGGLSLDLVDGASGWLRVVMLVEALLGLLLWGLFVVTFSRRVIR